jgi:hypothetical protein
MDSSSRRVEEAGFCVDRALTSAQVTAPEDKIPSFNAFSLIMKGVKFGGSAIGSPADIAESKSPISQGIISYFTCLARSLLPS